MTGKFALSAPAEGQLPWSAERDGFFKSIKASIPFDAGVAAMWTTDRPQVDEFMLSRGLNSSSINRWCRGGFKQDLLLREAPRKGIAVVDSEKIGGDQELLHYGHRMLAAMPHSVGSKRSWWLLLARSSGPFTPLEQALASLTVQQWHASFHRPDEHGLYRLIVGSDGRLLIADHLFQRQMLRLPDLVKDLLEGVLPVLEERYGTLEDSRTYDLAVQLAGQAFWVCARRSRSTAARESSSWYLELRPLEADELPVVGLVGDARVAKALAYLHDHYRDTPSLTQVARAVQSSPFHFHRVFRREVGLSPKHYLLRKQLQVAKWMLRAARSPIGEVAKAAGFTSHGHFTSTFHRAIGVSPSDYRDAHSR